MSEQRTALVAGGSGGIGRAVAGALSKTGHAVYIGFLSNRAAAERTAAECIAGGAQATTMPLDVRETKSCDAACADVYTRAGRLDVLVNCAALNVEAPAAGMDDETWRRVIEVNLDGAFRLSRAASKYMLLNRRGRIIHVSSVAATHGGRGQINYATAKAGLDAMTRVLALELGRKGVRVNAVAPGIVETEMSARIRAEYGEALRERIAVRRFGTPEDVASAVAFLASDAADYVTGQVWRVDGGLDL